MQSKHSMDLPEKTSNTEIFDLLLITWKTKKLPIKKTLRLIYGNGFIVVLYAKSLLLTFLDTSVRCD